MDILILGNGFDLAHGLKTSYKDFLDYCNPKKGLFEYIVGDSSLRCICETNLWVKHFITRQQELGNTWIDLEKEIYNVILKLKKMSLFRKQADVYQEYRRVLWIEKNNTNFNFLDIEKNLREPYYDEKLSKTGIEEVYKSYIFNFYIENCKDLIMLLYKHLRVFTQLFQRYIIEIILPEADKLNKYDFLLQKQGSAIHVLSFNYTDTYERLYKLKSIYADPKSYHVYVHGKANSNQDCNLVLGTHSFHNYLPNSMNEEIPVDFNLFKKHNQRHKYNTIEAYQNFLKELNPKGRIVSPVFHIIGHSLDKTDHSILKHVLLANKNSKINVYFHDEEAQERMIINITEIIGEEEVMSKVRFIHQHDEKRGILKLKEKSIVVANQT